METICAQTTVGIYPIFLESPGMREETLLLPQNVAPVGAFTGSVHGPLPVWSHVVGLRGPLPSLYS